MSRILVLLFLIPVGSSVRGGHVIKDCKSLWLMYEGGHYHPIASDHPQSVRTVYFSIAAESYGGQQLLVDSNRPWSLFINGRVVASGKTLILSLDSLSNLYSPNLFIAVHGSESLENLKTQIVTPFEIPEQTPVHLARGATFFQDFSILVSGILLVFILLLFRSNPQLTLDYFSFTKIFSVQERNENLLVSRITSSVNLLFYLFCALLTGFLLTNVFYFSGTYFTVGKLFHIDSMAHAFEVWVKLSLWVLVLLAAKLMVVSIFSGLFSFRESVSFQFFNFLRFVLFTAVLTTVLSLIYFIFRGQETVFYRNMILLALTLLGIGSVMALIKLLPRAPFSLFHLFSYLCASEIIPLVIIIKIFF